MSRTPNEIGYKTHSHGFAAAPGTGGDNVASVCVIPFPYDATISSTASAQKGPAAILHASRDLELFDSELGVEPYKVGIQTMDELEPNVDSPFKNCQVVEAVVGETLRGEKLPVVIGGDHSLTIGAVRAAHAKFPDLGFVMFDAHPDLLDQYEGTRYGHASVARRTHELGVPFSLIGMRSGAREETNFIDAEHITVVGAREILESNEAIDRALSVLPDNLYISIDLDVMDPGEMPAVANPEPGGLRWYDIVDCLERVISKKTVVGFDVVELCPIPGNPTPDFIAAKLIYRSIGLIFKDRLLST